MARNYQKGTYKIKNWHKYQGTKNPTFRSSYERIFFYFSWADNNPKVLKWSSEQVIIPYYNPVKQRMARYFVDCYIKYVDKHGEVREALIEIKPLSETKPPVRGNKSKKNFDEACLTYMQNMAKWDAASARCKENGWDWRLITENSIFKG